MLVGILATVLVLSLLYILQCNLLRPAVTVLYYTRFALLAGAILALFAPVSIFGMPTLLGNVFLLHRIRHVAALTALSLIAGTLVVAQYRTVMHNSVRFADLESAKTQLARVRAWWTTFPWALLWWTILSFSSPFFAFSYSICAGESITRRGFLAGFAIGLVVYLLFAGLVSWIAHLILDPRSQLGDVFLIDRFLARLASRLRHKPDPPRQQFLVSKLLLTLPSKFRQLPFIGGGARFIVGKSWPPDLVGYYDDVHQVPTPGHFQLGMTTVVLGAVYFICAILVTNFGDAPDPISNIPVSCYAIFLISLAGVIFSGIAYFLDFYRIPVTAVVGLYLFINYNANPLALIPWSNREHIFEVIEPRNKNLKLEPIPDHVQGAGVTESQASHDHKTLTRLPTILDICRDRERLIIVTAPGGGIHASAWTARVLTGLDERYPGFSGSVVGISATSGGSVGTMFYVKCLADKCSSENGAPTDGDRAKINADAQDSCLEAVGWGMGGPDLLRVLSPIPFCLVPDWDRGRAMEQRWENMMGVVRNNEGKRLRMRDWVGWALGHKLPAVAFNATEVETGRRVVFSTVQVSDGAANAPNTNVPFEPVDFLSRYKEMDVDVATAVRLSATFPYVSPAAIPDPRAVGKMKAGPRGLWHVVDGGYVDNEGIMTALGWIRELVATTRDKEIILIRINHGSKPYDRSDIAPTILQSPFFNAVLGPESAMLQVRTTSQLERGHLEADILARSYPNLSVVTVEFAPDPWVPDPPLNWKLSVNQKKLYVNAWNQLITKVDDWNQLTKTVKDKVNVKDRPVLVQLDTLLLEK